MPTALDFDPDAIFTGIAEELDEPDVTQFVVVGGPGGAVQYSAFVASSEGGVLDVLLGPDGARARRQTRAEFEPV